MFAHYPFIAKQHHVALESSLRNHGLNTPLSAAMLASLYRLAFEGLKSPVQETGFHTSSMRAGNITLGTATEAKSGIFVQLAKVEGQAQIYLTVGQKWAMESYSAALGNTSSIFW